MIDKIIIEEDDAVAYQNMWQNKQKRRKQVNLIGTKVKMNCNWSFSYCTKMYKNIKKINTVQVECQRTTSAAGCRVGPFLCLCWQMKWQWKSKCCTKCTLNKSLWFTLVGKWTATSDSSYRSKCKSALSQSLLVTLTTKKTASSRQNLLRL